MASYKSLEIIPNLASLTEHTPAVFVICILCLIQKFPRVDLNF